ncbi:kinase-like domain-containing protein, partial [Suillus placidus]
HAAVVERKYKDQYVPGMYMLLELAAAGGNLFDKIAPDVGIGENVAHYYFGQLLAGMARLIIHIQGRQNISESQDFIHREGVCHCGLKPENILLNVAGALKISDFGLAAVYRLKESSKARQLNELCGSLPYMAPEVHYPTPYEAEPIDVWGIGHSFHTSRGKSDQSTVQSSEFCQYIMGEIFNEPPWNRLEADALSLICGLLTVTIEPEKHMTLAEVFAHPWCIRSSQIAKQGVVALADHLTESLRAKIHFHIKTRKDKDGDKIMLSETHQFLFTHSLLLFSQTQSGRRYTPNLTRFHTSLGP